MMTAAEAKTRFESRNFMSTIKQLVEIETALNKAIDRGDAFIYYPHALSIEVENKLKEMGYKVSKMTNGPKPETHITFL